MNPTTRSMCGVQVLTVLCRHCQALIKTTQSTRESMEGGRCQECEQEHQLQNWAARLAKKEAP